MGETVPPPPHLRDVEDDEIALREVISALYQLDGQRTQQRVLETAARFFGICTTLKGVGE